MARAGPVPIPSGGQATSAGGDRHELGFRPIRPTPPWVRALLWACSVCESAGVEYAVTGAAAVVLHGCTRHVVAVDLAVSGTGGLEAVSRSIRDDAAGATPSEVR